MCKNDHLSQGRWLKSGWRSVMGHLFQQIMWSWSNLTLETTEESGHYSLFLLSKISNVNCCQHQNWYIFMLGFRDRLDISMVYQPNNRCPVWVSREGLWFRVRNPQTDISRELHHSCQSLLICTSSGLHGHHRPEWGWDSPNTWRKTYTSFFFVPNLWWMIWLGEVQPVPCSDHCLAKACVNVQSFPSGLGEKLPVNFHPWKKSLAFQNVLLKKLQWELGIWSFWRLWIWLFLCIFSFFQRGSSGAVA